MKLHDDGTFELTKAACRVLLAFASADECRAHICCVHFDPIEGRAYATDGHSLIKAQNCGRCEEAKPFSVPRHEFATAAALVRKKDQRLLVKLVDGQITMRHGELVKYSADGDVMPTGASVTATPVRVEHEDSRGQRHGFPPAEQVIPTYDCGRETNAVGVNTKLLNRLDLVAQAAGSIGCKLFFASELDPVLATAESHDADAAWTAVLMPMRV